MLSHLKEYCDSLVMLGGKRWRLTEPAVSILDTFDLKAIRLVQGNKANNDEYFARKLYPNEDAVVDVRYRRYVLRLTNKLLQIMQTCPIADTMDARKAISIRCMRLLSSAEVLLRTQGYKATRLELLEARSKMIIPELAWFEPKVFFALAHSEHNNRQRSAAIALLQEFKESCAQATIVSELLYYWLQIALRVRYKSDIEYRDRMILAGKQLLANTARKPISGVIGIAASRLATSISTLTHDAKIGLRWLERTRQALKQESLFDTTSLLEYHTQRAFIFRINHDYFNGVVDARKAIALSSPESSAWFSNMNTLVLMQLQSSQYQAALQTSNRIVSRPEFRKQPVTRRELIAIHALYAKVITGCKDVTLTMFKDVTDYTVDVAVLRLLFHAEMNNATKVQDSIVSLARVIDRSRKLRSDRPLWLLTRLLRFMPKHAMDLRECRTTSQFCKYESEIKRTRFMPSDNTVISPLAIWKAFITNR
ncbi:MAG: hypothetical protein SGJ05_02070 [bacterium]|nr:hypothetical protein [bacterium]